VEFRDLHSAFGFLESELPGRVWIWSGFGFVVDGSLVVILLWILACVADFDCAVLGARWQYVLKTETTIMALISSIGCA